MTSPVPCTEDVRVLPGHALLRDVGQPADLAAHRSRYGELPDLDVAALIALTEAARLRGRGGAGFPFARKLAAAAAAGGVVRRPVVVVNASEGEPASSKDAALARHAPHLVLDGAAAAATALGARDVHVAVPGDRPRARALLGAAVAEREDRRIRWHLHVTGAQFVAGQSQAVLELLSGRPGLPVTSWQPAAVRGHRGRPAVLSNAETWAHLGLLALEGLRPTLARGTHAEPGTTLVTVHGPGAPVTVREVEHGAPLVDVLPDSARGGPLLVGGFHGTWAPWKDVRTATVSPADLRDRGVPLGAGVLISVGPDGCPLDLTRAVVAYLAEQSAGRCGPCFNGLPALARAVAGMQQGGPSARDEAARLSGVVTGRGACAHPDGTARLVSSLLTALPEETVAHAAGHCPTGSRQVAS